MRYELARDEDFRHIFRHGAIEAMPDEAHSVHVELDDLQPEREYFYRFKCGPEISPVGRTRTAPPGNRGRHGHVRVRFVPELPRRLLHAVRGRRAAPDIEAVVHLGDYIYEGGARVVRKHEPVREIFSLDDYRIRHGQYKTDLDLQAAHAAHPWLVTWDDHEFKNNYANLDFDPDVPIEVARARRAAAYLAYWEHMPLARARKPQGPDLQLYRRFHWGNLATFNVLDGRQYRSDQPAACTNSQRDPSGYCPDDLNPEHTMLGTEQRDWLLEELATTKARWNVLAQQTGFAPFNRETPTVPRNFGVGSDSWDGYVAERQRILDWMVEQRTQNPVVLTGDTHQNWIRNVPPDFRNLDGTPVATELMGTSISTNGNPATPSTVYEVPFNPHIAFRNNERGYVRCTLTPELWTSEFRKVDTVAQRPATASTLATFVIENGRAGAQRSGT